MAKGEDAVRRKKNKVSRKRMRNSESAVSARIASVIASKRRRQAGKRRACEGMCFTLPTPDDPFNDRNDPKASKKGNKRPPKKLEPEPDRKTGKKGSGGDGVLEEHCLSKFLILCLNAIQGAWVGEGSFDGGKVRSLLNSPWGVEFCRRCCSGSNLVDTSGSCASREQVAWVVSMASDMIARKEKEGFSLSSPFLLYLVPSQERAIQVRAVCKPLKALGVHTVSLHPGAALDHQVRGLKSCEPEFLISTPERLLELVSLGAIGLSTTSLLVLDGLKDFVDAGFLENVKSIRGNISGDPQVVVFSDCFGEEHTVLVQDLLSGPIYRLPPHDSGASPSALVSKEMKGQYANPMLV